MKRNILLIAIPLAVLSGFTFTANNVRTISCTDLDEAKKAIGESNSIYFQSFVRNDSSIFIDRYSEDCQIMVPNVPVLKGHSGALIFFKTAYNEIGLRNGKFITTAIYGLGNEYVAEEGRWQSFDENDFLFDEGKFLVLWKKTARGWKMFRDSFSTNRKGGN